MLFYGNMKKISLWEKRSYWQRGFIIGVLGTLIHFLIWQGPTNYSLEESFLFSLGLFCLPLIHLFGNAGEMACLILVYLTPLSSMIINGLVGALIGAALKSKLLHYILDKTINKAAVWKRPLIYYSLIFIVSFSFRFTNMLESYDYNVRLAKISLVLTLILGILFLILAWSRINPEKKGKNIENRLLKQRWLRWLVIGTLSGLIVGIYMLIVAIAYGLYEAINSLNANASSRLLISTDSLLFYVMPGVLFIALYGAAIGFILGLIPKKYRLLTNTLLVLVVSGLPLVLSSGLFASMDAILFGTNSLKDISWNFFYTG